MRIEQYFLMTDYSQWEVILNVDSPIPTKVVDGVIQHVAPTTAEQRLIRKHKLKARGTQLEILGESLFQEDINMKFLRSLPTEWRTHTLIWRNKINLEDQSLDGLFNNFKIYEEGIAKLDADKDVTLVDAEEDMDAGVHRRLEESQAKVYHLDIKHADKVLITTATTTITAALVPKASAPRRRGIIIQDLEEAATASVIMQSEDKAFARELKAELNANINWNDVVDQVKRKERQDNIVMRYQALKRKHVTEAQARKNMMREAKKQIIDEEVEELKTYLQIIPNDEDDVYTKATPLALKMILLIERKYPLTRFTLEQMLNNIRLDVKEESEMSLELLRLMRLEEDYHSIKDVVPLVNVYTTRNVDDVHESSRSNESTAIEEIDKLVDGDEDEESYASAFADTVINDDNDDIRSKLEPKSYKDHPEHMSDDDDKKRKMKMLRKKRNAFADTVINDDNDDIRSKLEPKSYKDHPEHMSDDDDKKKKDEDVKKEKEVVDIVKETNVDTSAKKNEEVVMEKEVVDMSGSQEIKKEQK
nr:hypothetical protein [Tanacetum cinerariifolium]